MKKALLFLLTLSLFACAGPLEGVKSHLPAQLSCSLTEEYAARAEAVLLTVPEPLPELRELAGQAEKALGKAKAAAELACAIVEARKSLTADYLTVSRALVKLKIIDDDYADTKHRLDAIRHGIAGAQKAAEELGL